MDVAVPYDRDIEHGLLGVCMYAPARVAEVERVVDAADFFQPACAATFAAIVGLWRDGLAIDARSVSMRLLGDVGLTDAELVACMVSAPAPTAAVRYAEMVAEMHARRRLIALAGELIEAARTASDVGAAIDGHAAALADVTLPGSSLPGSLMPLDDMLDREPADRAPWVVPGLVRRDWRVVIVGSPGSGKSQVLQSVGITAAQGRHPFVADARIPPVRVLFVDLENPEERIIGGGRLVRDALRKAGTIDWDRDRLWVWAEPSGVDIRARKDRGRLETVLGAVRPDLVLLGPAYKITVRKSGEGWDEVAMATMNVLDDLRGRYGFGLMMEDHGTHNELRPFGSSLWLRWPEIGLTLTPNDKQRTSRDVGRFRIDRLKNAWPDRLDRGVSFPWIGHWENGIPEFITSAPPKPRHPELEWRDPLEDFLAEPRRDLQ